MANTPRVSIIVPVYNEAESLPTLYKEIKQVLAGKKITYECLFIDDGSFDRSWEAILSIKKKDPVHVKGVRFRTNEGKASAYHAGFSAAEGTYIVTLDADLQDDPSHILFFLEALEAGYDLVCGWKQQRKDPWIKNASSKIFNWFTNRISTVKLHDHNCGFKAFKKDVAKELDLYGELHRYIAVLISVRGYRVKELPIPHRARRYGKTKYNAMRFIHGFLDLWTVLFLTRFQARPLHLFGYIGIVSFLIGFFTSVFLTWEKIISHQSIGGRPLLLFSVMMMIMGVQIGVTGLVGELITSQMQKRDVSYRISDRI